MADAPQPPPPDESRRGLTLPGYRYLGPLNSLDRGVPRNRLDAAARKHDEKYHKITDYYKKTKNYREFEAQVRRADEEFLREVSEYTPESTYDQLAKWLAQGGIGTKYLIEENLTGVLYPLTASDEYTAYEIASSMEAINNNSVIGGGVRNNAHTHKFQFRKKFTFAIESTKATYDKTGDHTTYKTYIHSLPWQYIYFYLTEKEYMDMTTIFHTSRVTGVGIKITNLGNRTPFITSANAVNYANANSQTTIGIWENLEGTYPVKMGNTITSEMLYGKTIKNLAQGTDQDPDHSTAQAKIINNAIEYKLHNKNQEYLYLPPLIMEATILYNATNSIGPIYEKEYSPKDGTFHTTNERIHNETSHVIRNAHCPHMLNTYSGALSNTDLKAKHTKPYAKATVDNFNIGPDIFTSASQGLFMHSIGVGIIPLLNADASLEKAILNIMVETWINLECISHGTNLLMANENKPQPNTNFVKMSIDKKWSDAYTIAGAPMIE